MSIEQNEQGEIKPGPNDQQDLLEMADKFIEVANGLLAEKHDLPRVSAAFRYAASRFNAFEVTTGATCINDDPKSTIEWFTEQYKEMFTGNLKEHIDSVNAGHKH
ncbi:MAG: DUF3144 domain-containing protein [Fibrobacterales bacterium]